MADVSSRGADVASHHTLCALDVTIAEEIQNILVNPPDADRYATLKNALIKAFGKSQAQQDIGLFNLNGLVDKKPTALLRKINTLNNDPQTLKRALSLSNLPADVHSILAGQEFSDVEKLAEAADQIWEARCAAVQHITPAAHDPSPTTLLDVAAAGIPHQPNTLSVVDRTSGLSYLVDTGAEASVYPASVQDRRAQQPIITLTADNGTSIHTWGKRSVSLSIGHRGQYNHEFYLAIVTRPILGADFFIKHGLAIDHRSKRLLSLDNIPIVLRETKYPLTLAGLGFPLPCEMSSLLQQFPELLTLHFHHSTNKHSVKHHIVTHGLPTHARARRLDREKLPSTKSEFLQIKEMDIVCRSKSAWSSPLHIVPKSDDKWRPWGDYRRLNALTDDRYPLPHIQDFNNHLAGCRPHLRCIKHCGGGQLEQRQGRSWVPLAFFSRKLSDSEKKYSDFYRESLAFYSAVRHFRHFLEGRLFTLYTDHKLLTFALSSQTERSPRQTRHLSYISEFTTDIQHIEGEFNVVADALSRLNTIGSTADAARLQSPPLRNHRYSWR
ncbi:Pol polyprotein [Plakobranchus ocellatus]|uniref:Pol polyprotein n=1 Tax=Plakobranchus ocellatus TaxID=259542 RepID=A0AAV3YUT5_9GAST|nr:Pol polyprotein [Plakobranchus ocellatus]